MAMPHWVPWLCILASAGYLLFTAYYRWRVGFHDYLFLPLEPWQLDPDAAAYFLRMTPGLEQLGFVWCMDYLLQRIPAKIAVRCFLADDRTALGTVESHSGELCCSYASIFTNGAYLESSQFEGRTFRYHPERILIFNHLPGASLAALWESHRQRIAEYSQANEVEPILLIAEDCRPVLNYSHRLVSWDLYERGLIPDPPPPAHFEPREDDLVAAETE